jgi:hypothetical protein
MSTSDIAGENMSEVAKSSSLLDKIHLLVDAEEEEASPNTSSSTAFQQERCLVVWVLLTRLSDEELHLIWSKLQKSLLRFALLILKKRQDCCFEMYIRLVAQVADRLADYPFDLGDSLLQAWKSIIDENYEMTSNSLIELNIDVCTNLITVLSTHSEKANELKVLETIWGIYSSQERDESIIAEKIQLIEVAGDDGDDDDKEWKLMKETLQSLLKNSNADYYSQSAWDELVLSIFQSHAYELLPEPLMPSILTWLSKSSKVKEITIELRSMWFEWFMGLIQARLSSIPNDSSSFQFTLHRIGMAKQVNQFLLANIVSPVSDTKFPLRALAWQTTVSVVDACGFGWIMTESLSIGNAENKLGPASTLCAFIRLASGEWRIQLQAESSQSKSTGMQATALPVGNACARMLMNVVEYCVNLQEKNRGNLPLSMDAILHLRQSLEDSLATTVEYLRVWGSSTHNVDTQGGEHGAFSPIAVRLLGSLLREVDIWDLLEKDDSASQNIIECLRGLLSHSEDFSLLPALVHMLADADTNPTKQGQLGCLYDQLTDYLERFWQRDDNGNCTQKWLVELGDTLPWASSCTELWADFNFQNDSDDVPNKRRLRLSLVEFIQNILLMNLDLTQQKSYLSLSVGCYMTLSKDQQQPPSQHESRVIFRALQICEIT